MKSIRLFAIGLCLLASGCGTVTYLGDHLSPTNNVDVYYSEHDVPKAFHIIGHMSVYNGGTEFVKKHFVSYAQKVGADAIVITGTEHSGDNMSAIVDAEAVKYN